MYDPISMADFIESESNFSGDDGCGFISINLDQAHELSTIIRSQAAAIDHICAMQLRGFITLGDEANSFIRIAKGGAK